MPFLCMYLVDDDVRTLCEMLNDDPDIALIVPDGPGRWKAQRSVPTLPDGHYALWHIPSGPISLYPTKPKAPPKVVKNPFRGWKELVNFQPGVPWFGAAPLGIFNLTLRRQAGPPDRIFRPSTLARPWTAPASEVIGRSDLDWVGRYYSIIGDVPAKSTQQWWTGFKRRVDKLATGISCSGPLYQKPTDMRAFPAALAAIKAGHRRADNPT